MGVPGPTTVALRRSARSETRLSRFATRLPPVRPVLVPMLVLLPMPICLVLPPFCLVPLLHLAMLLLCLVLLRKSTWPSICNGSCWLPTLTRPPDTTLRSSHYSSNYRRACKPSSMHDSGYSQSGNAAVCSRGLSPAWPSRYLAPRWQSR